MQQPHLFMQKLSKEDINALPLRHYSGPVEVVRTLEEQKAAVKALEKERVIGFDTETRPAFQKGKIYLPSLVQLAGHDITFIFHLGWAPFGQDLVQLFENPAIIKTGVAVHDDLLGLQKILPFKEERFIDLADLGKKCRVGNLGLRGLAAQFLHIRISKGERCSNWANRQLTDKQIRYAATDAWVSREVYLAMEREGFARVS